MVPPRARTASTVVDVPRDADAAATATATAQAAPASEDLTVQAFATTPEKAMLLAEIERLRTFCIFISCLVVAAAGVAFLVGGDRTAQWVNAGAMAVVAVASVTVLAAIRDPARYRTWFQVVYGQACIVGATAAFYYWGPFSAVLLIIPFGAYIFSMSESVTAAAFITVSVMVSHATMSGLVIFSVIEDRGLMAMPPISVASQLIVLGLIHSIFLATFAVARMLRASAQRSVEELDEFARAVARRDALLAEARQDLFQALQIGGPGPYSGRTVGSFELGAIIGRGAMGEIYEGQHTGSGSPCAVKLLNPRVTEDSQHYKRFVREAEIAASIDVPNVVRVLEIGTGEDEVPYLAMERLHGEDLSSHLKKNPRMLVADVLDMLRQVGHGLEAAHRAGIVHRDLKPQNIFRAIDDAAAVTWKVLDFGVSKLMDSGGTLTQGKVVGTPSYMAPEQAQGHEVDGLADIYSLGVIAYRALTGIPAFAAARDIPKVLYQVVHTMPQRPSEVAHVGPELDDVLAVAMAKDPRDRFAAADELADAIAAADRGTVPPDIAARARRVLARTPWRQPKRRA